MGGSSHSEQHQVSSNKINPMQMQQYQDNYSGTKDRIGALQPYTGQVTAGFNPNQIQAQGVLSGVAQDPRYAAINKQAMGGVQSVLDDPTHLLAGTDLSPYMNPFQKNVIDASVAQNEYARNVAQVHDMQSATHAGSFQGAGTRQGVAMGETNAGYDRNNQQNIAGLNSTNFSQALQSAQQDIQNRLSQNTQRINAGGMLSNLNAADLQRATQQGGILSAVGDAQQAQEQRGYGDAFNLYQSNTNLEMLKQQLLNQALGIIPLEQTNTSDGTTTTKSNPGAMGILGGIASLGSSIASMGPGLTSGLGGIFGGSVGATSGAATNLGSMAGANGNMFNLGSVSSGLPGFQYKGIFG